MVKYPASAREKIRSWADDVAVEQCEDLVTGDSKEEEFVLKFDARDETQASAFKAVDAEMDGDLVDET